MRLAALPLAAALAALAPPPAAALQEQPDLHETSRDVLSGGFVVEDERWARRSNFIMHVPNSWRKVRLRWTTADARLTVFYEDDGHTLRLGSELKAISSSYACSSVGGGYAYGSAIGTAAAWRAGFPAMVGWLRGRCPHADAATMAKYRAEFLAAADAFPPASARFRSVATAAFGGIARRCIRFQDRPFIAEPFWNPECTRWSGPRHR